MGRIPLLVVAGILALVLVIVVVVRRTQVYGVEQNPNYFGVDAGKNVACTAQSLLGGVARTDDKHDGVGPLRKNDRVGDRQRRRRIHDDVVVLFAQLRQHVAHVGGGQQLRRIGWGRPGWENVEVGENRGMGDDLLQRGTASQHIAQA